MYFATKAPLCFSFVKNMSLFVYHVLIKNHQQIKNKLTKTDFGSCKKEFFTQIIWFIRYIIYFPFIEDGAGFCHEELALGYANRSAVLFQMKEYELCIRDITRAFDNSYPNNLMYKLFERKARCLKALKQFPRALESMKSAEMWMKYSTLNETKSSSFKKDVSKQIEFLDEKVSAMSISEFANACEHR